MGSSLPIHLLLYLGADREPLIPGLCMYATRTYTGGAKRHEGSPVGSTCRE